jgi:hypothetical protein
MVTKVSAGICCLRNDENIIYFQNPFLMVHIPLFKRRKSPTIPNYTKCAKILPVLKLHGEEGQNKTSPHKTSHQKNTPVSGTFMSNSGTESGLSCISSPLISATWPKPVQAFTRIIYKPYVNKIRKARLICITLDRYTHLKDKCTLTVPTKWPVMCSVPVGKGKASNQSLMRPLRERLGLALVPETSNSDWKRQYLMQVAKLESETTQKKCIWGSHVGN